MYRDLPPSAHRRLTSRLIRGIVAAAVSVTIACSGWSPAQADSLDDQQDRLRREIAAQADVVEDAHAARDAAVDAAAEARRQLADAQAALAKAEAEQQRAAELDAQREEELQVAEHKLKQARADVAAAEAALESVNARLNEEILVTTQQSHGLLNLALLFTDLDTSNLNQRAQLASTLFDSSQQQLDELDMRRLALEDARAEADAAEQAATKAREEAAAQLEASKDATERAEVLRADVERLSRARDAAEAEAKAAVEREEQRQRELEAENASVQKRIQERIEQQKREQAAREQAAREQAAAAGRENRPSSGSSTGSSSSGAASGSSSSSSLFMYPVSSRITSKYGMRLHPVLGYWKLHDGTDFGAACGTPIKAAYGGVVSERYYNAGYGNRLMIDHGRVNGAYVTTGYNHAQRYVVSVGQRVTKGQVIGYVGTTGYSTGCHLHLMVWENGNLVNPMAKWFG